MALATGSGLWLPTGNWRLAPLKSRATVLVINHRGDYTHRLFSLALFCLANRMSGPREE